MKILSLTLALLLGFNVLPATSAEADATAKKKAAAKKRKTSSKKKSIRRTVPKPPPVNARLRATTRSEIEAELTSRQITYENPGALVPFFEQLYRAEKRLQQGPLAILHYGDSHTAADEWTGELRNLLQARFGDGGAGFSHAGRPWSSYRRLDVKSFASHDWYSDGLPGREGDGMYGLSGVSITTHQPNQTVMLRASGPILEVLYLKQPGGGSLTLEDSGQMLDTISTDGPVGAGYYRRESSAGPHEYTLRTTASAPVRLYGWVTGNLQGITYETLGINGGQAPVMLNWDWKIVGNNIAERNPGLIVLAYGTNEASNPRWTAEAYRASMKEIIAHLREAAPAASILLVGPPDRFVRVNGRWTPYTNVDRIVDVQREIARDSGCAFLDLRAKLGGKGSMHSWFVAGLAQYDHVHFTAEGYRLIANLMFRDLISQYQVFLKAREQ